MIEAGKAPMDATVKQIVAPYKNKHEEAAKKLAECLTSKGSMDTDTRAAAAGIVKSAYFKTEWQRVKMALLEQDHMDVSPVRVALLDAYLALLA